MKRYGLLVLAALMVAVSLVAPVVAAIATSYSGANGTAAIPTFSFMSNTNRGMFNNAGVAIADAGAQVALFGGGGTGGFSVVYGRARYALIPGTSAPACTSGAICTNTPAPTITGNDSVFRVKTNSAGLAPGVGATANGLFTFANAYEAPPNCFAYNSSQNAQSSNEEVTTLTTTTTTVTVNFGGALTPVQWPAQNDIIFVKCDGNQ